MADLEDRLRQIRERYYMLASVRSPTGDGFIVKSKETGQMGFIPSQPSSECKDSTVFLSVAGLFEVCPKHPHGRRLDQPMPSQDGWTAADEAAFEEWVRA